jgi:hypothetical protein
MRIVDGLFCAQRFGGRRGLGGVVQQLHKL